MAADAGIRTSYDRYYEGRKDFGQLVSNVRSFTSFKELISFHRTYANNT